MTGDLPMNIDASTQLVALLGRPVGHSRSPQIHNLAFQLTQQNFAYVACEVADADLADAVRGLQALGFRGANVTIPHKRAAMELMDELTPSARATGAVNTIICEYHPERGALLVGDNTDVEGFTESLKPVADDIGGRPALVLGAGGAARAVVFALVHECGASEVLVAARSTDKARRMLEEMQLEDVADVIPFDDAASAASHARLVVNTTPVGMHPHVDQTPLADLSAINHGHIVTDIIYTPRPTRLLREAAERGARTIDGLGMFIGQAAASFRAWTGVEMPVDEVRRRVFHVNEG